jgi:hypothetical protein
MNTLLDTRASVLDVAEWRAVPIRRLTPVDRLALRVGLALVLWARRPVAPERETVLRRAEQLRGAEARREAAERASRLLLPLR